MSINGYDFASSALQFEYISDVYLWSLNPQMGPMKGGTSVTISGHNLVNSDSLMCRFGDSIVPARWISSSQVACDTPEMSDTGSVSVDISVNGIDYTSSNVQYTYYADATILGIEPATGPSSGGTEITIVGSDFIFSSALRCRIGTTDVAAEYVSAEEIKCETPLSVNTDDVVAVAVSNNGIDYTAAGVTFAYYPSVMVLDVSPHVGGLLGKTIVTVSGSGFEDTSELACYFGDKVSPITRYISSTMVECEVPASDMEGVMCCSRSEH